MARAELRTILKVFIENWFQRKIHQLMRSVVPKGVDYAEDGYDSFYCKTYNYFTNKGG